MARIGFVSTMESVSWGGSEALWSQTAARLREQGVDVFCNLCTWPHLPPPLAKLEQLGCVLTFRRNAPVAVSPSRRARARRLVRRLVELARPAPPQTLPDDRDQYRRWIEETRPDLVVISQGYYLEGQACREVCQEMGVPFAPVIHSAGDCGWPGDGFAQAVGASLERSARCYFVSDGLLHFTRRALATPLPDAHIVRNPYNVVVGSDPLPWPETPDGILQLACVGRLECVQKGQDLLFDALRAPKWQSRPLHITLYGDGPNRETLQELAKMYGLQNVTVGGFEKDVTALWGRHHALVLPSRYEGLPIVIVEAMLCGRPCIVTDVGGSAELLEDNRTGFIATAPTPSLIDEALERAWEHRAEWPTMGIAAAKAVRERIPGDPIGVWAAELRALAAETKSAQALHA